MPSLVSYGPGHSLELNLPQATPSEFFAGPAATYLPLDRAVDAALASPLEYPPLARAVVPGDRVVLALAQGLPAGAAVVAAIVAYLVRAGLDPADISVLRTLADFQAGAPDPTAALPPDHAAVTLETHDPTVREQLGFLGQTHAGAPLHINRLLSEADVVLPVGWAQANSVRGSLGVHASLYPLYADEKTVKRYRGAPSEQDQAPLSGDADEVGRLLGVQLALMLVPAAAGEVHAVLAGVPARVAAQAAALHDQVWTCRPRQRADLVLAAISGDSGQQTWDNVGRAVQAASHAVTADGAIAVLSGLAVPPGQGIGRLASSGDLDLAVRRLRKERPADGAAAQELARALGRGRVYLLSQLEPAIVEELGLAPIGSPSEAERLVQRHASCLILSGAQHANVVSC